MAVTSRLPSDHLLARAAGRLENERFRLDVSRLVPRILADVPAAVLPPDERHPGPVTHTGTRIAVVPLGRPGGSPTCVLLIPQTDTGSVLLGRQAAAERTIRALEGLRTWRDLVPEPLLEGTAGTRTYLLERALPGHSGGPDAGAGGGVAAVAARAIGSLHRATLADRVVDDATLDRWVRGPVARIRTSLARAGQAGRYDRAVERLEGDLLRGLRGRSAPMSWVHGDFWPGNVLVDDAGNVVGIVDWDRAAPCELPCHDLLHYLVYTRRLLQGIEPGAVVADTLAGAPWSPDERAIVEGIEGWEGIERLGLRTVLLLYWLRFVAATFEQADFFARNPRWRAGNLDPVLRET